VDVTLFDQSAQQVLDARQGLDFDAFPLVCPRLAIPIEDKFDDGRAFASFDAVRLRDLERDLRVGAPRERDTVDGHLAPEYIGERPRQHRASDPVRQQDRSVDIEEQESR
jgi:hypothetical protein